MSAVKFLAKSYHYATWMRKELMIGGTADERREKILEEALEKEKELFRAFFIAGAKHDMFSCNIDIDLDIEESFKKLYKRLTDKNTH